MTSASEELVAIENTPVEWPQGDFPAAAREAMQDIAASQERAPCDQCGERKARQGRRRDA